MSIVHVLDTYQKTGKPEQKLPEEKTDLLTQKTADARKAAETKKAAEEQAVKKSTAAETSDVVTIQTDQPEAAASETYQAHQKQTEKETAAKEESKPESRVVEEQLSHVANVMTEEDYETLAEEGFPVDKMTPEQLETAIERIKLQKELKVEGNERQIEQLQEKTEQILKIVRNSFPNNPRAEKIAKRLENANIPVTEETIKAVLEVIEMSGVSENGKITLSDDDAQYLVTHKLNATVENLYIAKCAAAKGAAKREKTLTEETWKQLEPSVTKLLFHAGIKNDKGMIEAAKTFIRRDIPLTTENMLYFKELKKISLNTEDVEEKAVDALTVGKQPKQALLSAMTSAGVKDILGKLPNITDPAVEYAAAKAVTEQGTDEAELSLQNLFDAQESIENGESSAFPVSTPEAVKKQGAAHAATIRARRQLEEIKAKMTFESGYRLAKQGIRIDAEKMNKLVDALRELENGIYSSFLKQAGASVSEKSVALLKETTEKINELKSMPALLIAETAEQKQDMTLGELHTAGNELTERIAKEEGFAFRKFKETYEAVMTSPRGDMGDTLRKAFGNIDHLITEAGMEPTEEARRAVRILAYNRMEVNQENIAQIEAYDNQLNRVLTGLHPAVTVRMIRDGIQPLSETLDSLEEKIDTIKTEEGITEEERFSNFLVNLEKEKGITDKERQTYIGIYRALHHIDASEGAALGAVFKSGQKLTLTNLQKAIQSGRVQGFDKQVDDAFGASLLAATTKDREAIAREVDKKSLALGENAEDILKKSALNADKGSRTKNISETDTETADMETLPKERVQEEVEQVRELAKECKNPSRFLDDYKILPTMENLQAAQALLSGDTTIFKEYKRILQKTEGDTELPDLTESLESKEEMQNAVSDFAEKALALKKKMYQSSDTDSIDLKALKGIDIGIRFMRRLSKREFYQIPVDTGEDITNVNVTVVHEEQAKGKVIVEIPTETLGKVTAEATVRNQKVKCFISSDTKDGTESLRERQLNLFAALSQTGVESEGIFYGTEERPDDTYLYKTDGIYQEQGSDKTNAATSNNELYRVAKAILLHVKNADNSR